MVIMDNYCLQERLADLWMKIDSVHLKYIDMEVSPEKLQIRKKLEDLIMEYLSITSHNQKFILPATYEVLHRSAMFKDEFSIYKAATGFDALQLYAANLFTQPWRKEYKQIRKYSGFFKHQVESNLMNAELLLEVMGYKTIGLSTLVLEGPINPDSVINVSKDCLIAYVECQIVKLIWEEMASSKMNISWLKILEFRQLHLCNFEQSVKALKYQYQQQHFQEHHGLNSHGNLYHMHMPINYSFPPVSNHEHIPPPVMQQYMYGTTGCVMAEGPIAQPYINHNMIRPQFNANGYYGPTPQVATYSRTIPIAQLIEVEPQNGYNFVSKPGHSRNAPRAHNHPEKYYDREETNRDSDKTDSFENWDYVYKTLETQGYNKDLGERGDVLNLMADGKVKHEVKMTPDKKKKEKETKKPRMRKVSDSQLSPTSSYDNVTPSEKRQSNKTLTVTSPRTKPLTGVVAVKQQLNKSETKNEKKKMNGTSPTWHCKACTYLNHGSMKICEMCSKTNSNVEDEVEVGGPECENCTLVNPRDAKNCQACEQSLENSPTRV